MGWIDNFKKKANTTKTQDSSAGLILEGVGTENRLINSIYKERLQSIYTWRERYSQQEYPYKVVLNTVYQSLQLEILFAQLQQCFDPNIKKFDKLDKAYDFIMQLKKTAIPYVQPNVEETLQKRDNIGNLNIKSMRILIDEAQNGDTTALEKIEHSYFWYAGGIELMYYWAAYGLMSLDFEQARAKVCSMVIGVDYKSMDDMQMLFGNNINLMYQPLEQNLKSTITKENRKDWQNERVQEEMKRFIYSIEKNFHLNVSHSGYYEVLEYKEMKEQVNYEQQRDSGEIKGYYLRKDNKFDIRYDVFKSFVIYKDDNIHWKVYIIWIAIEIDDNDYLISTNGEPVMEDWDFTKVLEEILQKEIHDVGAVVEEDKKYRKFTWVYMIK